ncbi:MAG: 16S rRNA (uracil(1498)-N(3))-methyltransferase [Chitinivibrionia bacterium]|nr:16S rRNA (uracil(1498)-N(3))-methyltransferase [Chitinivibrionia bacterium]
MSKKDAHFLFFSENINENSILLDSDEVAHISNVLRFSEGDEIRITDGKGNIFESKIVKMKRDSALCEIISTHRHKPPLCAITVAIGMPEKEKLEDVCEMLAPLGVAKIVPLITNKCQKNYADERWEKVAQRCRRKIISSIKQSLNPHITVLEKPVELGKFCEIGDGSENSGDFETRRALSLLGDFGGQRIDEIIKKGDIPQSICIFVGPPSGFSQDEIDSIVKTRHALSLCLGEYRLRTELAAVCAAAAVGQAL